MNENIKISNSYNNLSLQAMENKLRDLESKEQLTKEEKLYIENLRWAIFRINYPSPIWEGFS